MWIIKAWFNDFRSVYPGTQMSANTYKIKLHNYNKHAINIHVMSQVVRKKRLLWSVVIMFYEHEKTNILNSL